MQQKKFGVPSKNGIRAIAHLRASPGCAIDNW